MLRSIAIAAVSLILFGCPAQTVNVAPAPESGSDETYEVGQTVPVDMKIYHISGIVSDGAESLTRQTAPAQGYARSYDGYGYASYFGAVQSGKGFVRLLVEESDSPIARKGNVVILKVEDTKAIVLAAGDVVSFKCRTQYESLSAVAGNEILSEDGMVKELDYCRLATPEISK